MAAVSIRNLDDQVRERLRVRGARLGRSMEAEIRAIAASCRAHASTLAIRTTSDFAEVGVDLVDPFGG